MSAKIDFDAFDLTFPAVVDSIIKETTKSMGIPCTEELKDEVIFKLIGVYNMFPSYPLTEKSNRWVVERMTQYVAEYYRPKQKRLGR